MAQYIDKITEVMAEAWLYLQVDSATAASFDNIREIIKVTGTSEDREDLPYYGFELATRIIAVAAEHLTGDELAGLGDQYKPMYRIYELASRRNLFTALHLGRVILHQLSGIDRADAPDYTDAHFISGEYEMADGVSRKLTESELEFIHREAPEVIHMLVSQEMAGA